MSVKLLHITENYAKTIEYAARTSTNTACGETPEEFTKKLVKKGHLSVGRHCDASFEVICSRACSHQLVRHTHLAYTQESQRYVKFPKINTADFTMGDIISQVRELFVIPPNVFKNGQALIDFTNRCVEENFTYHNFIEEYNIPKEDARYCLPNACKTRLVVSGNFQAFYDFIKLRTDKAAQWEIREIAEQIRDILLREAPAFFSPLQEKIATEKQDKKNSKLFNTIDKVMKFQELAKQGIIHPLTCGNDSSHKHLIATVKDGKVILMCPDCDYIQNYIPDCVMNTDLENLDWRKENG